MRNRIKLAAMGLIATAVMPTTASYAKGPVVAYFVDDHAGTSAALANLCIQRGIVVVEQDDNHVVCSGEMRGFSGALAQLLIGNSYSTTPQQVVRFQITSSRSYYTIVQASMWIETQMAFGQVRRETIDGKKQSQQLLSALQSAGAFLTPPAPLAPVPLKEPQNPPPPSAASSSAPSATSAPPSSTVEQPAAPPSSAPAQTKPLQGRVHCDTCE